MILLPTPISPILIPKVTLRICGQVKILQLLVIIMVILNAGCTSMQPQSPHNLCDIFEEKRSWYKAAVKTKKRWGVPLQIPMAIMYQESSFKYDARPPRNYILGFIPWGYVSSAYGYAQAKTATWADYMRETDNNGADRDDFEDAMDFVGWFINKTHKINKVSKWDAKGLYLNYHEGWGGYRRGSHNSKGWLLKVSNKVKNRAQRYSAQYQQCKKELEAGWIRRLFM